MSFRLLVGGWEIHPLRKCKPRLQDSYCKIKAHQCNTFLSYGAKPVVNYQILRHRSGGNRR
ncbi:MAG: hypothetical protein EOO89_27905 [Pedobacter sp.]|nr:MAG: hypothetical protein EOO89_27905 [Pedobacter sp.]